MKPPPDYRLLLRLIGVFYGPIIVVAGAIYYMQRSAP